MDLSSGHLDTQVWSSAEQFRLGTPNHRFCVDPDGALDQIQQRASLVLVAMPLDNEESVGPRTGSLAGHLDRGGGLYKAHAGE